MPQHSHTNRYKVALYRGVLHVEFGGGKGKAYWSRDVYDPVGIAHPTFLGQIPLFPPTSLISSWPWHGSLHRPASVIAVAGLPWQQQDLTRGAQTPGSHPP